MIFKTKLPDFMIIGAQKSGTSSLKNFVELRNGTVIGSDCYIDSRVSTSGNCTVGNRVTL